MKKHTFEISHVEEAALSASSFEMLYPPEEKIPTIVVEHFPQLGQLTALRFLEWAQSNPGGVISLPTGKTPEYFIRWVQRFLEHWDDREVRAIMEQGGLDVAKKPDLRSLHFVQIDEFYPMDSSRTNSFHYYVQKYYLEGFGLDPDKALLIDASRLGLRKGETIEEAWPDQHVDLSLRYRQARGPLEQLQKDVLARVDQWCMEYEDRIRSLGGIGFFLGGIGPDGHIGFNIRGSDHHSTTRLCPTNYETQAASATDLGGIETARKCLVITIGLETITTDPDCTAIVMAAGEAKARLVAQAVQSEQDVEFPATALQILPNARFYITRGAATQLVQRQRALLEAQESLSKQHVESILVDVAASQGKQIVKLTEQDCQSEPLGAILVNKGRRGLSDMAATVHTDLTNKIERGTAVYENKTFLHTEPHHDDIMLGYFAHVARHFRRAGNTHFFLTLTSGFTSVTNEFLSWHCANLRQYLTTADFAALSEEGYFAPQNMTARNRDIWQYLDGTAAASEHMKDEGCARRFLRDIMEIHGLDRIEDAEKPLADIEAYLSSTYPGNLDPPEVQRLKGMCREWEAECLWGYYGWKCENVRHLRLGFYTGDVFTPQPTQERDVMPVVEQLREVQPDILTVALDPEASGPDTHYKVLQTVAEALRIYQKQTGRTDVRIWGYRNVWYRFDPSEANLFIPVSLNMFSIMHQSFENAFMSQRQASFPSYEYDGPFSELAQQIQVQQYTKIKTCLGREWFHDHSSPLIRATRGLVFLREMEPEEFYQTCRELKESIETV